MEKYVSGIMDRDISDYYRFTETEMLYQKERVIIYILTRLTSPTIESLRESLKEINELTGYDISVEATILIRSLANCLEYIKNEETKTIVSHTKKKIRSV